MKRKTLQTIKQALAGLMIGSILGVLLLALGYRIVIFFKMMP